MIELPPIKNSQCPVCKDENVEPYKISASQAWLREYYRCANGHRWMTGRQI